MKYNTRDITFHKTKLSLTYRDDSDMSVIEEIFVDRLYRCVEDMIPSLEHPILDIGAHTGLFSIYARILNPDVDIIACEPEPTNFEILKINLKQNHIKHITSKQIAITHIDDTRIPFYISSDSHNHSTVIHTDKTMHVDATTLKKLLVQQDIQMIGLLKMDIEGAEYHILKNLKHDTWDNIQHIVLEYHGDHYDRKDLEQLIREHGFSVEHFPSPFDKRYGLFLCRNKRHKA